MPGTPYAEGTAMNTFEARQQMFELGLEAREMLRTLIAGGTIDSVQRRRAGAMAVESRTLLGEAGYPAESVWRAVQRTSLGLQTQLDSFDRGFWQDVLEELERGMSALEALGSGHTGRDADLHIVG